MKKTSAGIKIGTVGMKYIKALNEGKRYIISEGGTRSGKTFDALQIIHLYASKNSGTIVVVVGLTVPVVKANLVESFKEILGTKWSKRNYNSTDRIYTYSNGSKIMFNSADSPDKYIGLKSDIVLLDEHNLFGEGKEILSQLSMRCEGFVILTSNPSRIVPHVEELKLRETAIYIHSTYKDNLEFLPLSLVADIEARGKIEPLFRRIYLEGLYAVDTELAVYTNWSTFEGDFPDNYKKYDWKTYGLDFGYSNDPTALIEIVHMEGKLWVREHLYKKKLSTKKIRKVLKKVVGSEICVADSAEPRLLVEVGIGIPRLHAAKKPKGSILTGITRLQGIPIMVHKDSKNLIRELYAYTWKKVGGVIIPIPIDRDNHLLDALRYGVSENLQENSGIYSYK